MIKKLQNSVETLVEETLEGYVLLHKDLVELIPGTHGLIRTQKYRKEKGKVKYVLCGGAGHEPGALDSVRYGDTDLFLCGGVYAAPAWKQLVRCINAIDDGSPILLSITNHAGDVMNAKLAMRALTAVGVDIRMVITYDDVASAPKGRENERRGMLSALGRIVGHAAEMGCSIDEVERLALKARDNARSYGFGLRSAIHPITGMTIMPMPEDTIEMGIGMHGESSGNRIPFVSSRELAEKICDILLTDLGAEPGEELAVMLNGLGGMTCMEMSVFYRDMYMILTERGFSVYSGEAGNFTTTQELGGLLVSIGRVDEDVKKYWNM